MTKLRYPSEGIYFNVKTPCQDCKSYLTNAKNKCSFSVPSRFEYRSYLLGLANKIKTLSNEMNVITEKISRNDNLVRNTVEDVVTDTKNMRLQTMKLKDRMIK